MAAHDKVWNAQAIWQRAALNEKEMELLELREQHARLVVSPLPGHKA